MENTTDPGTIPFGYLHTGRGLSGPYLLAAVPCAMLDEPDGSTTLCNIYNCVSVLPPTDEYDGMGIRFNVLACAGEMPGTHILYVEHVGPDGRRQKVVEGPMDFIDPYQQRWATTEFGIPKLAGRHFFDVLIDDRMLVRVPLDVEVEREPLPPLEPMRPYPERGNHGKDKGLGGFRTPVDRRRPN